MGSVNYREQLVEYIRTQANPPDKFSHHARLYKVAVALAAGEPFDDDVVFAAAWIHDLGVFIGHRPEDPHALAGWDNLVYVLEKAPEILRTCAFPDEKIPCVLEAVRTHMPAASPGSFESALIHDADILEQLGAVGILRTVSKVGRDTRFLRFGDALAVLRKSMEQLPPLLRLERARALAGPRVVTLRNFLEAAEAERNELDW